MSFPTDIKNCMKDCILNILWPRKDVYSFFADNGCNKNQLTVINRFKENDLNRSQMIDLVFAKLGDEPDGGLGPFRAILHALLKWDHFDSYYFDELKKLDRAKAQKSLDHLKQLQEIRDAKLKSEKNHQASAVTKNQMSETILKELNAAYVNLVTEKISPQKRGFELEKILQELSKLSGLETTAPFRTNGEQIDGAIKYDGEHYVIEAKWHERALSNEPVYQFVGKVEGKMYGRGIFISINGFSENVLESLVHGKALKTILIDGEDLVLALEGKVSFTKMIDSKVKAAQTRGEIFIHPITGNVKK